MNIEELRQYALTHKGVTEEMPFDDNTLVFKIGNKMFLLASLIPFDFVLVKCNPEKAEELRSLYRAVMPGYHMNKRHWNSVYHGEDVSDEQIYEWITDSYRLVLDGLSKKQRDELKII